MIWGEFAHKLPGSGQKQTPMMDGEWRWREQTGHYTHLSPGVSLISDLAHDSGILQSELFTSRSQNLVLAKLPNSGFWRYGQFFK